MKKIVCELCECMEFTKEGGMFICNSCGTKYTAEEARGMMREVEGAAPAMAGGAPAAVPMGNPNQQQLDNILLLASSAYEADNKAEAENYCNQAIVLDAMCYKAWMLKGKAVGWQSKIDNLRIEEAAHSFCKAIDFAPEEELKESSVDFRIVARLNYSEKFSINRELQKEILLSFKKNKINIPYKQVVVHNGKRV